MRVVGNGLTQGKTRPFGLRAITLSAATLLVGALVQTTPADALTPRSVAPSDAVRDAAASGDLQASASPTVVTLLTGQRIILSTAPNGVATARLAPGSHARAVNTMSGNGHHYVVPRLPMSVRRHLDVSVFDVTRLADGAARVPLIVRFARGVAPRNLPGISIDPAKAAVTPRGDTVVHASYDATQAQPGDAAKPAAWRGVSRVALPTAPTKAPGDFVLHTLTLQVTDGVDPLQFADVWVQNVDDSSLFSAPVTVFRGEARVSVPEGNYSLMGTDYSNKLAVDPDFAVTTDVTHSLDLSTATAQPKVTVPGVQPFEATVMLTRQAAEVGAFSWSFGSDRFNIFVTPVAGVEHGALSTTLGSSQLPPGEDPFGAPKRITYTKDERAGIPAHVSITHHRADFAAVPHRYFDNGSRRGYLYAYGFTEIDNFAFIFGINTLFPSTRTLFLQGSPDVSWLQQVDGYLTWAPFSVGSQAPALRPFEAGSVSHALDYFRAPNGPGVERANVSSQATGPRCLFCRVGDEIHGALPIWGAAGGSVDGSLYGRGTANWSLRMGRQLIDHGVGAITPRATVTPDLAGYTLTAEANPQPRSWVLGTRVTDEWRFKSGTETAPIPLMLPSYLPSENLSQTVPAGPHHFRLNVTAIGVDDPQVNAAVQVSYDDGKHWRTVSVDRIDQNSFVVRYDSPAADRSHRYASLRVIVRGKLGMVKETAIRAYRVGKEPAAADKASATGRPSAGVHACKGPGIKHYRCFAIIEKSGRAALTKAGDPAGWGATDLRDAYGLDDLGTSDQTVAVVVAYDYPTAEADLNKYRKQFGLPVCTSESGCFTKINQAGETDNYPSPDQGWALEAALDLQMISTSCPTCNIVLAEAKVPSTSALNKATDAAVAAGADVTNHSYGIQEYTAVVNANSHYATPGTTAVAASGDDGYGPASFPASSPDVVTVGGTTLRHASNERGWVEKAWRFGGSGCSAYFDKPGYQSDPACGMRMYADLATAASDIAVYDSFGYGRSKGWFVIGGTSASSPLVAGMIGAAEAGGLEPGDLYGEPGAYLDITKGTNGLFMTCRDSYVCNATAGYDGPTGWGSPLGLDPFAPPL